MRHDGPKTGPRWPKMVQDGPKMAQDGPKMGLRRATIVPRRVQDGPRWSQDGRRVGPRRLQGGSKMLLPSKRNGHFHKKWCSRRGETITFGKMAPAWPKMAPRLPKVAHKILKLETFCALPVPMLRQVYVKMVFPSRRNAHFRILDHQNGVPVEAKRSFSHLGPSWVHLVPSWGHLGGILVFLGLSWAMSGVSLAILGDLRAVLGSSWGHLEPPWGYLGPTWDQHRPNLGLSWELVGFLWSPWSASK